VTEHSVTVSEVQSQLVLLEVSKIIIMIIFNHCNYQHHYKFSECYCYCWCL